MSCAEPIIYNVLFGICDGIDGQKAFSQTDNEHTWVVKVLNPTGRAVTFVAIDNCIEIRREDGSMSRRCDSLLFYEDNLVFVELKNQRQRWIEDAIEQLEETIKHFIGNQVNYGDGFIDIAQYRHKRAYASNKRHPHFQVIDTDTKQRFFNQYRFRVNIQADIKI